MNANLQVRYSSNLGAIQPDDQKIILELNAAFDTILDKTAEGYGRAVRSARAKKDGIIEGKRTVRDALGEAMRFNVWTSLGGASPARRQQSVAQGDIPEVRKLPGEL